MYKTKLRDDVIYPQSEYDDGLPRPDAGAGRGFVNPDDLTGRTAKTPKRPGFKRGGYVKQRGWGLARQGRKRS